MNDTQGRQIPRWTLGDRLRKVRRDAGYSSREFAELLGINLSSLAHYETDRARPRNLVELMEKVSTVTGVPVTWLLGLDSQDQPDPNAGVAPPTTGPVPVQALREPLFIDVALPLTFKEAG